MHVGKALGNMTKVLIGVRIGPGRASMLAQHASFSRVGVDRAEMV